MVNSSNIIAPRNPNKVPAVDKGVVNSMPATPVQQGKAKATYLHPKFLDRMNNATINFSCDT